MNVFLHDWQLLSTKFCFLLIIHAFHSLGLVFCIFTFDPTLTVNRTARLHVLARPEIQISSLSLTIDEKSHSQISCVASIPGTEDPQPLVLTWFRWNMNISNIKSESRYISITFVQ